MGMNVHRVAMATVAISVLAAVAGVVVAPVFVVDPFMWLAPLVTMLAIVVLGGLGSLKGSLIGALIIGPSRRSRCSPYRPAHISGALSRS